MTGAHLTNAELVAFVAADMSADELARADSHLASCATCKEALAKVASSARSDMLAAVNIVRRWHLTFEEIEALAQNEQVEALAEAHVEACESCQLEVEDLRGFIARERARDASAAAVKPVERAPSILSALIAWVRMNPQTAGLAAAAATIALIVSLPATRERLFPGGGGSGSGTASILSTLPPIDDVQAQLRLSSDRADRLRRILAGETVSRPPAVDVASLSAADRDLWTRAQQRYTDSPLILGALAQDIGLIGEARANYQRALATQPGSAEIRRLLSALE